MELLIVLLGCVTPLTDQTPYIDTARLLAVQVEPPEIAPGGEVVLTGLYADETGALSEAAVDWAFCTQPRPLAESGPVALSCLEAGSEDLAEIGTGLSVQATLPVDGCSLFGPNPPPSADGLSAGRPADPDGTGGFYQPVVGFIEDIPTTLVAARMRCGIANVTQEDYAAWNSAYVDNQNPTIASATLVAESGSYPLSTDNTDIPRVTAGETVQLQLSLDAAEDYVVYQSDTKTLETKRESLSVTYYATEGQFEEARKGISAESTETAIDNGWTAPTTPGPVWIAFVLRDSRGGLSFAGYYVQVEG